MIRRHASVYHGVFGATTMAVERRSSADESFLLDVASKVILTASSSCSGAVVREDGICGARRLATCQQENASQMSF
jgi:hypothetical protein